MQAEHRQFADIHVGTTAAFSEIITAEASQAFANVSGDHNPLHTDDSYAQQTPFGKRVVHGMHLAALLSRLVGMYLPGKQALYVSQELQFRSPVLVGERVEVHGTVTHVSSATKLITIHMEVRTSKGLALEGQAIVSYRAA